MARWVGARGPHGEIASASRTFKFHKYSLTTGKKPPAVGTTNVCVTSSLLH